ncbi:Pimeloyl-ACP methyl ester carboxylesterase [Azospirillum oryzae]|uniref:Pimeloyl-ACP methyl ester carboxylesterase n=1 Tax=Azospirillum oryzae TaxID=286727 RepID=A0A1X7HNR1_9PROT|nr:alpha/beta hydrolase [Azospirillum oryzae]SMF90038.1 Pimeloyl-ACP methyl ester carboxylesterase [Azospirillum oryzae]
MTIHIEGDGDPTILFVHGFCCAKEDWSLLVSALSKRFKCVSVDLPGHGASSTHGGEGGTPTIAAAAAAVNDAKARHGSGRVILVGHSLGAKIIREAYRQSSTGIIGMVLVDGSLYVSDRQTMLDNANKAIANGTQALIHHLFAQMFTESVDPSIPERIRTRALAMDPGFASDLFLDSVEWDTQFAVRTIQDIRVPVLVLQATTFDSQFRWQPLEAGGTTPLIETVRSHVSDSTAVVLEGAGHFLMIEAPEAAAKALGDFVERVAAPPQGVGSARG